MDAWNETPPTILAVDDSPTNLAVLSSILEAEPCHLLLAESGEQALVHAREGHPQLILLDVMMPGMNGYQVCQALKSDPATQDIPVMFITSRTDLDDVVRGFETGALDYVSKPFEPLELLARVRTHLELHRRRDQERRLIAELREALDHVKLLSGLLPICAHCKKVRDDHGFWQQVEAYISTHSEATFSHGLCPDCIPIYFPDFGSQGGTQAPKAER